MMFAKARFQIASRADPVKFTIVPHRCSDTISLLETENFIVIWLILAIEHNFQY